MTVLLHPTPLPASAKARPFPAIDLPDGPAPQAAPAPAPAGPALRKTGWLTWLLAGTAVVGVLGMMGVGVGTVLLRRYPAQPAGDWLSPPQAVSPQRPPGQPSQPATVQAPPSNAPASADTRRPQAPAAVAAPTPAPAPRSSADDLRALKQPGPNAQPAPSRPAPAAPAASASPAPQEPATMPSAGGQPDAKAAPKALPGADPASVAGVPQPDPMDAPAPQALVNMVAALTDDIAQEHRSDADMRQQIASLLRDTDRKLSDFDRRLAAVEANPSPTFARAGSGRASAGTLSVIRTAASAAAPPGGRRYEVRAASPGVALLGTLDGTPAVVDVAVGDQLPGYGRVNAIVQAGQAWSVLCEHGTIAQ